MKRPLFSVLVLAMLASCARPQKPHPAATPTPPPTTGTPAPAQSAPSTYGYIYAPPIQNALDPSAPQIREIDLNANILSAPGPVRVRVLTNAMVSSLIVRTLGHELVVPQIASGLFGAEDQLPNIPFFLRHRTYSVDFIATGRDGRTTDVHIPITLQ
jgi:hypothetical protein